LAPIYLDFTSSKLKLKLWVKQFYYIKAVMLSMKKKTAIETILLIKSFFPNTTFRKFIGKSHKNGPTIG